MGSVAQRSKGGASKINSKSRTISPAVLALGSACAWCARTLIGQQAIHGRLDFREQRTERRIDPQLFRSLDLGHVLLEIGDGLIQLPKHKLGLVSKHCSGS